MTNPKLRVTPRRILGLWLTQITNSERAFSVMVISKRLLLLPESSTHSTCNVVSQMMILKLWSAQDQCMAEERWIVKRTPAATCATQWFVWSLQLGCFGSDISLLLHPVSFLKI
jgi:hypothetical protein